MEARINRIAVRCHLPSGATGNPERLSRLFQGRIAEALDAALAAAAFDDRAEICVRRLVVPSQVWIGMTDAAILSAWAAAALDRLRDALDGDPSDDVVLYRSRTEAVLDAIRGSARGATARAWAWRRIGLPVLDRPDAAVAALLRHHPPAIVPAFRAFAHELSFRAAVARLDDETVATVVDAAVAYAGSGITVAAVARCADRAQDVPAERHAGARLPRAIAALRRSPVLLALPAPRSIESASALALLAVLEAEPALLGGEPSTVARIIAAAMRVLEPGVVVEAAGAPPAPEGAQRPAADVRAAPEIEGADGQPAEPLTADRRSRRADVPAAPAKIAAAPAATSTSADAIQLPPGPSPLDEGHDQTPRRDQRQGASTEWAGLLFLIHVARDLDLAGNLIDDAALAGRPLAWVLQHLAMMLVPAPPEDAAVRAFAGLPPIADPATVLLDGPRESERASLVHWAQAIGATACARLEQPHREDVLYALCARRGEIVAEPGWIEVRLSLDQVSIDVRRAGLDLDPDYIDWLGLVMKVVYA